MTEQPTEPEEAVAGPPTAEPEEIVETDPETFPREYVQRLRDESAKYRQRAGDRDVLAERLHIALVAASGRLADPTDLAFDEAHLSDDTALTPRSTSC